MTKAGEMRLTKAAAALLLALLVLAAGATSSAAQDLTTGLAEAEANVATYEGELPAERQQVAVAEGHYRSAALHAAPPLRALRRSKAEARHVRRELAATEQRAHARIAQAEDEHQQEVDDHDEEVRNGIGFGLAALVAGLIALAWGSFRASAPVAALTRMDLSRAVGLCVGGGLLTLIVGGALGQANGLVGALGSFIFCLGLILPTALLLARHSVEVQGGRSQPLLRRERLPTWVPMAVAGLMLVLFLASTGSAIFAPSASSQSISPRLQEEAEGVAGESGAEELEAAQEEVVKAKQRAMAPLAWRHRAQRQLASARGDLHRTQAHLGAARSSQRSFTRQLVALEEQERQEREEEEEQLEKEQQEEQERIEEEEHTEELASECDPNYSGCLNPNSSDYDCLGGSGDGPDYTGTVTVLGEDHYGLDADGDGTGCDP
jgi:hypothetical protein